MISRPWDSTFMQKRNKSFLGGGASDMYYNKIIAVNSEHLDKVMELVNIKTKIAALEESKHDWFDIAKENGVDLNRGYKFTKIEEKTNNLNKRLLNIINSFK